MGNHDYFWEPTRWIEFAHGLGFHVLINEHTVVRHGRAVMVVAGLPDPHGGMHGPSQVPDLAAAVRGAPRGDFRLLIAHQPRETVPGAQEGFQLAVAGHTHGGQTFPWSLLNPYFHPFTRGLNRVGGMFSYVSRGTGYWGPPNRLGVPGEITLLILTGMPDR
jgi:predicted MPP superfamily phosphohydrolase